MTTVILLSVLLQTSLFLIFFLFLNIVKPTCVRQSRIFFEILTSVAYFFTRLDSNNVNVTYKYFSCCVNVNANIYDHNCHNLRIQSSSDDNMKMYTFYLSFIYNEWILIGC